jgi:hypothetical protein
MEENRKNTVKAKTPGIHSMLPRTEMYEATRIYRDAYDMIPNAKIY